jgi:hypothetical protein
MAFSWNEQLRDQLTWHWEHQVRPNLAGLDDAEYLWEPAPGAWSLRPRGSGASSAPIGDGAWQLDWAWKTPTPPPVTTIAWRLAHVTVGCLAMRSASHFGRAATDWTSWEYADTATTALAQLDQEVHTWLAGVEALGEDGLLRPCGPAEPFPEAPLAALVLHIHRELIHHLAEVQLLRDLYPHRRQA